MMRRLVLSGLVAFVIGGCGDTVAAPDADPPADDGAATAAMAGSMDLVDEPAKRVALILLDGERVDTDGHPDNGSVLRSLFTPAEATEAVSRIEVVMGRAGSKIYGPEAREGVILIWTKAYDEEHPDDHDAAHRMTLGTEHGSVPAETRVPDKPNR